MPQDPATANISQQQGPQVTIEGSSLVLIEGTGSMPLVVYFELDSDVVDSKHHDALDALAGFLHGHGGLRVDVQGHADERGSAAYNKDLSLRRAQAVKRYLVSRGVEAERLGTTGFGERRPRMSPKAPHRRNRRVEFAIGAGEVPASEAITAAR